jgi:hypothetical protein
LSSYSVLQPTSELDDSTELLQDFSKPDDDEKSSQLTHTLDNKSSEGRIAIALSALLHAASRIAIQKMAKIL